MKRLTNFLSPADRRGMHQAEEGGTELDGGRRGNEEASSFVDFELQANPLLALVRGSSAISRLLWREGEHQSTIVATLCVPASVCIEELMPAVKQSPQSFLGYHMLFPSESSEQEKKPEGYAGMNLAGDEYVVQPSSPVPILVPFLPASASTGEGGVGDREKGSSFEHIRILRRCTTTFGGSLDVSVLLVDRPLLPPEDLSVLKIEAEKERKKEVVRGGGGEIDSHSRVVERQSDSVPSGEQGSMTKGRSASRLESLLSLGGSAPSMPSGEKGSVHGERGRSSIGKLPLFGEESAKSAQPTKGKGEIEGMLNGGAECTGSLAPLFPSSPLASAAANRGRVGGSAALRGTEGSALVSPTSINGGTASASTVAHGGSGAVVGGESDPPLSFKEFMSHMRENHSADIAQAVFSFIDKFHALWRKREAENVTPDQAADEVHAFLDAMEKKMLSHSYWGKLGEVGQQSAFEGLEKFLLTKLYPVLFTANAEEKKRDEAVSKKIVCLSFVEPVHLDLPPSLLEGAMGNEGEDRGEQAKAEGQYREQSSDFDKGGTSMAPMAAEAVKNGNGASGVTSGLGQSVTENGGKSMRESSFFGKRASIAAAARFVVAREKGKAGKKTVAMQATECLDMAMREMVKMNSFKAPRDKIVCVLNSCRLLSQFLSLRLGALNSAKKSSTALPPAVVLPPSMDKSEASSLSSTATSPLSPSSDFPFNEVQAERHAEDNIECGSETNDSVRETRGCAEEEVKGGKSGEGTSESRVEVVHVAEGVTHSDERPSTSSSSLQREASDMEEVTDAAVVGADDFLPLLVLVLLRVNPPKLVSNVEYCIRFRHPSRLRGEAQYYLTNLHSAVLFIENMTASSLTIDEKEYEKMYRAAADRHFHDMFKPDDEKEESERGERRSYSAGKAIQPASASVSASEEDTQGGAVASDRDKGGSNDAGRNHLPFPSSAAAITPSPAQEGGESSLTYSNEMAALDALLGTSWKGHTATPSAPAGEGKEWSKRILLSAGDAKLAEKRFEDLTVRELQRVFDLFRLTV
uniref:VPS9 domain-containing protein n=1 Tax=Palpitomonas bilix TaxID=652834 RepID=A0A7S3FZ12_9EUKA|mmetsp:Transcript_11512/g.30616  ORF Transcript_11512/g.30616 Transcript_11512/m.30616 type:complete len:1034 (+) Transcript_11512:194-3295(+)